MKKFKGILIIVLILAVLVFVVMGAIRIRKQTCETFVVKIENAGENNVFTQADVDSLLRMANVYPLGKSQKSIKRDKLESALSNHIWFDGIRSLSRHGGELTLVVDVKRPLVRVFPQTGESYLIDVNGCLLPDDEKVLDRLPVLNGSIKTNYRAHTTIDSIKEKPLINAYKVISTIVSDEALAAQFTQFIAKGNGEIDMYSTMGNQIVHVGTPDRLNEKLQNLHNIYAEALVYMNLSEYSQLDIRYKNRIYAKRIER